MVFIALSILSSASIFVIFKLIGRYKVVTFSAILINYFTACLAGFFVSSNNPLSISTIQSDWFTLSLLTGVLFILLFYVIGLSTQRVGVTVTTIAGKMSVVFPIAFSIWYDSSDSLTLMKLIGIILALFAVFLTVYKKPDKIAGTGSLLLPVTLFVGMGVVDSFIKFAQSAYISSELSSTFSTVVFAVAGVSGLLVLPFNRSATLSMLKLKTWVLGVALGLVNFGSIYFLLLALNHTNLETGVRVMGSVVFGVNNIGIVALSVLIGFTIFRERPSALNWSGIALSLLSIAVLFAS